MDRTNDNDDTNEAAILWSLGTDDYLAELEESVAIVDDLRQPGADRRRVPSVAVLRGFADQWDAMGHAAIDYAATLRALATEIEDVGHSDALG